VKVKDVKFGQTPDIPNHLDLVLAKHEHAKRWYHLQVGDLVYLVVVEVKKDQVWEAH
jgi:hypothetical protein